MPNVLISLTICDDGVTLAGDGNASLMACFLPGGVIANNVDRLVSARTGRQTGRVTTLGPSSGQVLEQLIDQFVHGFIIRPPMLAVP